MLLDDLTNKRLISPPSWLCRNTIFLCYGGSRAYGTTMEDSSDYDVWGWTVPKKDMIFPHLRGVISGFGDQGEKFDQFQQHHVYEASSKKNYDVVVTNIVKVFELARQGNPNIIDAMFVPQNCIITITQAGQLVRENRRLFLSKKCWPRYKGYAFSMLKHLDNKNPTGKRLEGVKKWGYDLKFSYHIFRLLDYIEQILMTGDLDLQQNSEQLKAIRRGEYTEQQIHQYFQDKERQLEEIYLKSELPTEPDEKRLKQLLIDCLECHYGDLSQCVIRQDDHVLALKKIDDVLEDLKQRKAL